MNGYHAEENAETFREAVQQLADAARRHFRYQLLHEEESSRSNRLRSITQWTLGPIDEIEPFFDERPSLQGSKKGGIGFQFLKVRQDSRLFFLRFWNPFAASERALRSRRADCLFKSGVLATLESPTSSFVSSFSSAISVN